MKSTSDVTAIRHNLLGQASAICIFGMMQQPDFKPRTWPAETVVELQNRTIMVYAQLLRFIAGMIDRQDPQRKLVLAPFRKTIEELAHVINAELGANPA